MSSVVLQRGHKNQGVQFGISVNFLVGPGPGCTMFIWSVLAPIQRDKATTLGGWVEKERCPYFLPPSLNSTIPSSLIFKNHDPSTRTTPPPPKSVKMTRNNRLYLISCWRFLLLFINFLEGCLQT